MIERLNNPNEDIEALLPWYEMGTLPPKDAKRVEDYLATAPDGARFLALIREEVTETVEANESAGTPSRAAFDRLMDSIAAEPRARRIATREAASGLLARLFSGASAWMPAAAAAACLVILVQAAALGVLLTRDMPTAGAPGLASGDAPRTDTGSTALVRFSTDAKAADISTLLRSVNAVIVDGPKPGGVYRIRISAQPLANEQLEEILQQIRARSDIITIVSVSG